jgi:glycosyltransferase involved in cell wall biosynthesis
MRILLSAPRYDPYLGGVETHTKELAVRLSRRHHEVIVLTTDSEQNLPAAEVRDGVEIVRVPSWPKRGDPYFVRGLSKVIESIQPDLVHAQGYQSAFSPVVLRTSIHCSLPTILTFHGGANANVVRNALYPLQRRVLRRLLRRANALVVLTRFEAREYAKQIGVPPARFVTIPNGSDLPDFAPPPPSSHKIIGSIGRLDKAKGHDRVVRAFAEFAATDSTTTLRVIGRGPELENLVSEATSLGVQDRIEFVSFGANERTQFAQCISQCSLFISMSRAETQPIAVLEAAAMSKSIGVSTESHGMRELVEDGIAWPISPTATTAQLAEIMRRELANPQIPDQSHLWTWEQCVDAVEALYVRLLGESKQ